MNRKLIGGAVALLLVAVAVWFFVLRDGSKKAVAHDPKARTGEITPPAKDTTAAKDERPQLPPGQAPKWKLDVDREGPLSLEGQVVGPDGKGVGGAVVWLGSVPPRSAKSEDDGTFSFDKLVGRTYYLTASTAALVGGPVSYKLTEKSDPVVIRLAEGATVIVSVVDDAKKPIAGADVAEGEEHKGKTDENGKAKIAPVRPGWIGVQASAAGFAPNSGFTTIGSAGVTGELTITLRKGYAVSGKVVDEAGKPIAKAKVSASGGMWDWSADNGTEVITDDKGAFQIAALAAGTHTLAAIDNEHAPARSTPITVKDRPIAGVTITMKSGGVLAGTVVDSTKQPVAHAIVRVAGLNQDDGWGATTRQVSADQSGKFELRGLARVKMQARAESDTAASKLVPVDLAEKASLEIELVLDVTGKIAGFVVDDTGTPVPEVQVNAFPDILAGASTDGIALAGMSSATTDGAGAFVVHGLPDGAYRLWAARSTSGWGEWGQQGSKAKTGDTNVKITLAAPGELVGKIVVEGTSAPPAVAMVDVGSRTPTPATNGAFHIKDITPGTYDITFRGPEFAETIKRDVKIDPKKTTDIGTTTVMRGRRLTGKVVDKSNQPVAGAKVRVGEMLFSAEGAEDQMDNYESMAGIRSAVSDQSGEFTIIGLSKKATTAMADHADRGRSLGVPIADGTEDPAPLTLVLKGYGALSGRVTMKGKPQPNVTISVSSKGGGAAAAFAETDDDGAYAMAKVPEGPVVVQAMKSQMMAMKSSTATATVVAGKETKLNIAIPVGEVTLTVTVKPLASNKVDAAQVFLFTGTVAPQNAKQLTDGFFQGGAQGMKFWFGGTMPMPEFEELVPGEYSICTIPITGDLSDQTFQQRLQKQMEELRVYCKVSKLAAAPKAQTVVHEVPAMTPLSTPTN